MTIMVLVLWLILMVFLSKIDQMSSNKVRACSIISVIIIIFSLIYACYNINNYLSKKSVSGVSGNYVAKADGFTIEDYEVDLNVNKNGKVEVVEKIGVDFYETGHHGIYKYIPYWLEYTSLDGKTISRKSNISNLTCTSDLYTTDTVNGKLRIKIGNARETVYGDHTYVIKYEYDMGSDPYNGFDEFIFHAFGDYWGTEIKNPKIVITMPKGIDGNVINFYRDKYRNEKINDLIDYQISGNVMTITSKKNIGLTQSLTVDIELPENYFDNGSFNYGWKSFIISMIIIGITGGVILLWSKYGKNYEKRVPTVEFYAPDNLNSAEIGYIYNQRNSTKKLTISLIVELASKKYIKIDEETDIKNKTSIIKITNLLIKPKEPNTGDDNKRLIVVKKLKEIDNTLNSAETSMMEYLFKDEDIKSLEASVPSFLEVKDKLISGGFVEIVSDNISELNKNKQYVEAINNYNKEVQEYNDKVASLPKLSQMELDIYNRLFESSDSIILSEHTTFYKSFSDVDNELDTKFNEKIVDVKANNLKWISFALAAIVLDLGLCSFFSIEDMAPSYSFLYYAPVICIPVIIIFACIMGRKTDYGEIISARVEGFRDFLETAEKPQLEAMVEKNPNYFYDILPYTYVLNISKKWIEKFQNIKMPKVEIGDIDLSSGDSIFNDISESVYYPVFTSSGGSGCSSCSSCSSCGGGCSSCGGGCSSCGGGGSW